MTGTFKKRRTSARHITTDLELQVSPSTVRRGLREGGITGYNAVSKPYSRAQNVQERLPWAKKKFQWTEADWEVVLWSDESSYTVFGEKIGIKLVVGQ